MSAINPRPHVDLKKPKERKRTPPKLTSEQANAELLHPATLTQFLADIRQSACNVDPSTGCWLCTLKPNNKGYVQPPYKQRKVKVLHLLSYYQRHGHFPEGDGSHLCNHPNCFNPDHICDESKMANNRRKGCLVWVDVSCECGRKQRVHVCPHAPSCMK